MNIERCPKPQCDGEVSIFPSYGGRRTGGLTVYFAECKKCGAKVDHLGLGSARSGIADWNEYAKGVREKLSGGDSPGS